MTLALGPQRNSIAESSQADPFPSDGLEFVLDDTSHEGKFLLRHCQNSTTKINRRPAMRGHLGAHMFASLTFGNANKKVCWLSLHTASCFSIH
jgi:hypothetical protein